MDVWQVSAHAEHLDRRLQQLLQVPLGHITLDHHLSAVQNSKEFGRERDQLRARAPEEALLMEISKARPLLNCFCRNFKQDMKRHHCVFASLNH